MGEAVDVIDAIERRTSCRAYTDRQVEQEKIEAIRVEIAHANEESGLRFQLYGPRADGTALDLSTKMFTGNPPWYAALVGGKGPVEEEKLGYYGERLVLLAASLGLSTCWVARTYNHGTIRAELCGGEALHDVIPIGYALEPTPLKQRMIRAGFRKRSKERSELYRGPVPLTEAPEWIQACIDAVWKGPSAINEQPVVFVQDATDSPVYAKLARVRTKLEYTDLGIAKHHFETVADACGMPGTWQWGDGGAFVPTG